MSDDDDGSWMQQIPPMPEGWGLAGLDRPYVYRPESKGEFINSGSMGPTPAEYDKTISVLSDPDAAGIAKRNEMAKLHMKAQNGEISCEMAHHPGMIDCLKELHKDEHYRSSCACLLDRLGLHE